MGRLVLVLAPPASLSLIPSLFSATRNFHFIKPWEDTDHLPLPQYLSAHNYDPCSITVILCAGLCPVKGDTLRILPNLGLVLTTSAGVDHIDVAECRRRGIQVAGAGTLFSEDVADLAVGLLLDVMTKISAGDRYVRGIRHHDSASTFTTSSFPLASKVGGKRVGIVGLGRIGMKVAKRLEGLGCLVMYSSRKQKPNNVSYPFYSSVHELAVNCDALVLCCALTDQTRHIVDKQVMRALGKEGFIVNIGRGALIDEKEMVQCLVKGEIGGAGLDVFEDEPNVPKELFELDNVVLSPHAGVLTYENFVNLAELMAQNLEAFFSNKPLLTPVMYD